MFAKPHDKHDEHPESGALQQVAAVCAHAADVSTAILFDLSGQSPQLLAIHGDAEVLDPEFLHLLGHLCAQGDASVGPIHCPESIAFLRNVPLVTHQGVLDGAIVLLDAKPHDLSESQIKAVSLAAELALSLLRSRRGASIGVDDPSQRSQVEIAVSQIQAHHKRVSDHFPGMLYQFELRPDGVGAFPFVGAGSRELIGIEPEELAADPSIFMTLVEEKDQDRLNASIYESAITGQVWSYEGRIKLRCGTERWIRAVSRPQYQLNGTIHWDGMMIDVTEQKAAASALEQSEERFRLTVENSMDGVVSLDSRGRVKTWNRQAERMFGWSQEESTHRYFVDLVIAPGQDDPEDEALFRSLTHPEALNQRVVIRAFRRTGEPFPLEFAWTALGTGDSVTYLAFLRDITEQVQAQTNLEAAKAEAESANKGKSEFLSRMSHELRTPLNAVLGFAQLLQMSELDGESLESVNHILDAGHHLLELINEVLDIARIESGQISVDMGEISVFDVVRETLTLVQPLAEKRGVRLGWPHENEDLVVQADRQRLKQVLMNLLSNGIKYTRDHGIVAVRLTSTSDSVQIHVDDDGPGIRPEDICRLFVPFDRLGADRTSIEGTGLGLPLTKRLVEAMSGEISVTSEKGQGTTFTVSLQCEGGFSATQDPAA